MLLQGVRRKQQGFGLLELMLSMVIVAFLLLMVTNYYRSSRNAVRIQTAITMIQQAYSASQTLANAQGSYANISTASVLPFLPNQSATSPFPGAGSAGALAVSPSSDNKSVVITIGTDNSSCQNVIDAFAGMTGVTASCSGSSATATASVTFPYS